MLWRDEDGFILAYATLVLIVLMGFAILAVDASRYKSHHTQLQKAADAAALAAAAELDRHADSLDRATAAITNLVNNELRNRSPFGTTASTGIPIDVGTDVRFLESLPATDDQPTQNVTNDPAKARFVEVQITRGDQGTILNTILPIKAIAGPSGQNNAAAAAVAVAGFDTVVCKFNPLYMCNPLEGTGTTIDQWVENPNLRRKMIKLKSNAQAAPGNFNYLQPPVGNPGASGLSEMIAVKEPNTCFQQSGVYTKPGNMIGVRDAFNVRFDIYNADMGKFGPGKNGTGGNPAYAPAPSVRKGWVPKNTRNPDWCTVEKPTVPDPTQGVGLPLDAGMETAIIGNGAWDLNAYWQANYKTAPPQQFSSRWEAYKYEVSNQALLIAPSGSGETSAPQCFKNTATNADRRALYGAVINCIEHQGEMNGAAGPLPVEAFAKFFLLQPVDDPGGGDSIVYAELTEIIKPPNDVVHDIVQLYR